MPYEILPLWSLVSYRGVATADGAVGGNTIVDARLLTEPSYVGLSVKMLDGGAAGQVRSAQAIVAGVITVAPAFTNAAGAPQQITTGTRFAILSIAGAGGVAPVVAPSIGLWMFGVCGPGMGASTTVLVMPNLAGFPNDIFNQEFWVQCIHNANNPGVAPEREIRRVTDYVGATGTFTCDAFTVNVEANDLVTVFHESILPTEILGFGTLDTSSATVPADSTRTEGNDYFNGCLLMTTEGVVRFQPRRIVDYTGAGGIFTLDPNNPFTAAPGAVDYIIIGDQTEFIPGVDGVNNRTPADVVGGKADTPVLVPDNVSSVVRYLKGILATVVAVPSITEAAGNLNLDEASALEQTLITLVITARARIGSIWLDMFTVTRIQTIRLYHQVAIGTYRQFAQYSFNPAIDNDGVLIDGFTAYRNVQVSFQCDGLGAAVVVPYAVV